MAARLPEPWVSSQLQSLQQGNPDVIALRVLNLEGAGLAPGNLDPDVKAAMNAAFEQARSSKRPAYGFVRLGVVRKPQAIIAVPVPEGPIHSSSSRPSSGSSPWRRCPGTRPARASESS